MSCNTKIPEKLFDACSPGPANPRQLRVAKVIYNYKEKSEQQIKDSIQLEIDNVLLKNPAYKFVNSKSHFNGTGGIDLQLNFELK